jgi:hypothetical protein
MRFIRLAKKNGRFNELYEHEIISRIRKKYSLNQELAILRQRDSKPEEFAEYNAFVEQIKSDVRKEVADGR